MSHPPSPFRGFIQAKISPNRSVALPRLWKDYMQGCFILCLEEENNLPRIQLIPESYKNERPEPSTFAAVEHRLVKFGTRARVTLPRDWCEAVGINTPGDLIITGRGCLIEFWAVENFNTMLAWEIQCPEDDDECADT